MKRLPMILLLLAALPSLAFAQASFPDKSVCEVRTDGNANCAADAVNDTVCVTGVVVAWKHFGGRGPGAIYDPASGCCISIFDIDLLADQPVGTLVEVCGWVGPFNGLDEIVDNPANGAQDPVVTVVDPGPMNVPCTLIRSTDIADGNALAETLESCCVEICGNFVAQGTFATGGSGTNYAFVDAYGDTCEVRVDTDTNIDGTPIPVGAVTIKGVLGQFDGGVPCTGYQILPRSLADLTEGDCTVAVKAQDWGKVKALYRDDD